MSNCQTEWVRSFQGSPANSHPRWQKTKSISTELERGRSHSNCPGSAKQAERCLGFILKMVSRRSFARGGLTSSKKQRCLLPQPSPTKTEKTQRMAGGVAQQNLALVLITPWLWVSQIKFEPFLLLLVGLETSTGVTHCLSFLLCSIQLFRRRAHVSPVYPGTPSRAYSSPGIQLYLHCMLCRVL